MSNFSQKAQGVSVVVSTTSHKIWGNWLITPYLAREVGL